MKALVVYFSRSGVTRAAAEHIAAGLGADIFELARAEPYPAEYRAVADCAMAEIRSGTLPELAGMPDAAPYDTVLVGSPTWCGTFAPPAAAFLARAPLAGKRVGVFCTSGGSGLAHMPRDAEKLAPGAKFLPPLALRSGTDAAAMDEWVREIEKL